MTMNFQIDSSWNEILSEYFQSQSWKELFSFIDEKYSQATVYPTRENLFNAFNSTPLNRVRVVILGQDPYHGPGQAHGLSFSVETGSKIPPSLRNILKEIDDDIGKTQVINGNLQPWADQGVLLLNSVLTVEHKSPASHAKKGWEVFTDHVIEIVSKTQDNIVFILWGAHAQKKSELIDESRHLIIKSTHPSPFSAHKGFFGSKPFSQTNDYLERHQKEIIEW